MSSLSRDLRRRWLLTRVQAGGRLPILDRPLAKIVDEAPLRDSDIDVIIIWAGDSSLRQSDLEHWLSAFSLHGLSCLVLQASGATLKSRAGANRDVASHFQSEVQLLRRHGSPAMADVQSAVLERLRDMRPIPEHSQFWIIGNLKPNPSSEMCLLANRLRLPDAGLLAVQSGVGARVHRTDADADARSLGVVNVVNHQAQSRPWILTAISDKLEQALKERGVDVRVSGEPLSGAHVVHHIPYHHARSTGARVESMLITHVDTRSKASLVRNLLDSGLTGICMSQDTVSDLVRLGSPPSRLTSVLLPPLKSITPTPFTIGFFFQIYPDGRKREREVLAFARALDPSRIRIVLMGSGWDQIARALREAVIEFEWVRDYSDNAYVRLMQSCDAVGYFGTDEGAVSTLDAWAAGKLILVPPIGFNLDLFGSNVTYVSNGVDAASAISERLAARRPPNLATLGLTWEQYVDEHIRIWRERLGQD